MIVVKLAASVNDQTKKKQQKAELIYNLSTPATGHTIAEVLIC
jgi:hypothetical protein